jgi:hypothetical protein
LFSAAAPMTVREKNPNLLLSDPLVPSPKDVANSPGRIDDHHDIVPCTPIVLTFLSCQFLKKGTSRSSLYVHSRSSIGIPRHHRLPAVEALLTIQYWHCLPSRLQRCAISIIHRRGQRFTQVSQSMATRNSFSSWYTTVPC